MTNQQVGWIVAAILIVGLVVSVQITRMLDHDPVPVDQYPVYNPAQVIEDHYDELASDCELAGGTWNAYAGQCDFA